MLFQWLLRFGVRREESRVSVVQLCNRLLLDVFTLSLAVAAIVSGYCANWSP